MAMSSGSDGSDGDAATPAALDRARAALRSADEQPPGGWSVLAEHVMRRARSTVRPDHSVLAQVGPLGDRTFVSTRVILASLRGTTRADTHVADDIGFRVEGDRLRAVGVSLVAAFGVDLVALADTVRGRIVADLDVLLPGPTDLSGPGAVEIDVTIVDVADGDPRRT